MVTIYIAIDYNSYHHDILAMSLSKEHLEEYVQEQINAGEWEDGIEIEVVRVTDGIMVVD